MLLIARHRNAPRKTRPADGKIFESAPHKGDDLIAPRLRLNKLRMRLIMLQQLALKGRQLEEIVLLADRTLYLGGFVVG